jgi:aspartyl-tRNA(Asn)/glutamyl-tRNA(Gln) amidotransferase subunit A
MAKPGRRSARSGWPDCSNSIRSGKLRHRRNTATWPKTAAAFRQPGLWEILERVRQLRRDTVTLFDKADVIVMPSVAALPWPAQQAFPTHIDGQEVGPRGHAVYTGWVNAAGLPALALPCAPSSEGLPIGMQLIGRYGADEQLLALGAAYEAAHPWATAGPPL